MNKSIFEADFQRLNSSNFFDPKTHQDIEDNNLASL
jgi:hypothetical protein